MSIELETPDRAGLADAVAALARWQDDAAPFQLHPGDLGWLWRFGVEAAAATTRVWRRDGVVVAVGELDGHALVRLGIAPEAQHDEELARRLAEDLGDPGRGVLGAGAVAVEAPPGALLRDLLAAEGWLPDESWTPLRRRLADPVEQPPVRVEVAGPDCLEDRLLEDRAAVQRAAFARSSFTVERWHEMAAGPAYAEARCLVAYDDGGVAAAAITVWSAGPGRPGLVEPMGVHPEHRGHGFGRAITLAGAAALRELGAASATVCTPTANAGGVATYRAAGFRPLPERLDLRRPA